MTARLTILLLAALAVAAIAAGCGGGGNSSSSAGSTGSGESAGGSESAGGESASSEAEREAEIGNYPPVSEAKFLKEANRVCVEGEKQLAKDLETYIKEQSLNSKSNQNKVLMEGTQKLVVPGIQSEIDQLREIGLPKGAEAQVEEILSAMQKAVYVAKEHPTSTPHDLGPYFEHAGKLAREFGIHGCGFA